MATYFQIQQWVQRQYGFQPKSCWIAHVKSDCGLAVRIAHNRRSNARREVPCPPEKKPAIVAALHHFGMLEKFSAAPADQV